MPEIRGTADGRDTAALAAKVVHQLRLALLATGQGPRVYLVTSPGAGDGRSSLAAALGMSFAAAGTKTLIIDFDASENSLSHRLHAQGGSLKEALASGEVAGYFQSTRHGLALLGLGANQSLETCHLSPAAAGRLLDSARRQFEVVLLDAGALLGDVAPSILAHFADAAVLVLRQNQECELVERCAEKLRALEVARAAAVFNRAGRADVQRIFGTVRPLANQSPESLPPPSCLGPLVDAVLRSLHLTRADDMLLRCPDEVIAAVAAA